jgi:hypothetical protein
MAARVSQSLPLVNAGSLADPGRMDAAFGWEGLGLDNLVPWNVDRGHWGFQHQKM